MKIISNPDDKRRSNVIFGSVEEAFKFHESKHRMLATFVLSCLASLELLERSDKLTANIEIPFKNTSLLRAAHRLGQFSLKESESSDLRLRVRASFAQGLANTINEHYEEKLPSFELEVIEEIPAPSVDGVQVMTSETT